MQTCKLCKNSPLDLDCIHYCCDLRKQTVVLLFVCHSRSLGEYYLSRICQLWVRTSRGVNNHLMNGIFLILALLPVLDVVDWSFWALNPCTHAYYIQTFIPKHLLHIYDAEFYWTDVSLNDDQETLFCRQMGYWTKNLTVCLWVWTHASAPSTHFLCRCSY